ncbi:MAG: DNA polymerase III subunit delta [Candidatus Omnitrophota bacterium]
MNYLIIGEDEYIKQKEIAEIRDKFLSEDQVSLNYSSHEPQDVDNISNSLGTMPFLADKRVILVKDAQELSDRSIETLIAYLKNPFDSSVLILASDNSLKKKKQYKELSSDLIIKISEAPNENTMRKWIISFFNKEKTTVSPEAVELIVKLVGNDTAKMKMELEKLICFSNGENIEKEQVEELVGRSVTDTVFKLVDAINLGDKKWTFRILNDLYDQKKEPYEIIGYLVWYIRTIKKISGSLQKGSSPERIASEVGYSPAYTRRLSQQAQNYQSDKIEEWISALFQADRDIKTGRKPASLAMEMLLVSLLK